MKDEWGFTLETIGVHVSCEKNENKGEDIKYVQEAVSYCLDIGSHSSYSVS